MNGVHSYRLLFSDCRGDKKEITQPFPPLASACCRDEAILCWLIHYSYRQSTFMEGGKPLPRKSLGFSYQINNLSSTDFAKDSE
jgi:hypothetical protein